MTVAQACIAAAKEIGIPDDIAAKCIRLAMVDLPGVGNRDMDEEESKTFMTFTKLILSAKLSPEQLDALAERRKKQMEQQ